jgi:ABC-2 type transport system permease protein
VSAWSAAYGILARDLARATRQTGRLLGGVARPFMWLLLIGTGYGAIARLETGLSYQAFVLPGIVVMAALFGGTLTAVSTVYDREFGMLRLMLASPAGLGAVLGGRIAGATLVGALQGGLVLAAAPLVLDAAPARYLFAAGALVVVAAMSAALGLLVAARLRSVENFAGIINVVLFPLLFLSGALYPTGGMPPVFRTLARANPVTYAVDLLRHTLGQPAESSLGHALAAVIGTAVLASLLAAMLFDPEQRFSGARGAPPFVPSEPGPARTPSG